MKNETEMCGQNQGGCRECVFIGHAYTNSAGRFVIPWQILLEVGNMHFPVEKFIPFMKKDVSNFSMTF